MRKLNNGPFASILRQAQDEFGSVRLERSREERTVEGSVRVGAIIILVIVVLLGIAGYIFLLRKPPIKIGILHSLTGALALSEKTMVDAELMAIAEINAAGGVLGRKIQPIVVDAQSDIAVITRAAEHLIVDEKVSAIIGCWSSSSRKAVKPIVEKHNNLLFYATSYEGLEESPNIVYTGSTFNQEIVPAVLWSFYNLGTRFCLVGSDNIFSHLTNEVIKSSLSITSAQIVGEEYILVGSTDVKAMLDQIEKIKPDVLVNTIYGDSNLAFYKGLRARGITPEKIPVMNISSVTETEFSQIESNAMAGDYATAGYFQSIDREENRFFVTNFKKKYGADRVVSESEEAGYVSAYIWARAVALAGTPDPREVKKHLYNRVLNAPSGIVYIDNRLLSLWKMVYVGKLRSDGQFTIVWNSHESVQPLVYPPFRSGDEWKNIELGFYEGWGKQWLNVPKDVQGPV